VVALSVPLVLAIVLLVVRRRDRPPPHHAWRPHHRARLLVDDAIIAIEMMVVKMEQGWDRARAATYA
jgi:hypothetical protein